MTGMLILFVLLLFWRGKQGNVFNLLNQIANGRFMMIGKGNNQKSMSYIRNVVAFIEFLIEEKKKDIMFIIM